MRNRRREAARFALGVLAGLLAAFFLGVLMLGTIQ